MRARLLPFFALAVVAAFAAGGASAVEAAPACGPSKEVKTHDEAVFGHFASLAAARAYKRGAVKVGFKGLAIEADNCGDFELEADGADTLKQRSSFAKEATGAGFHITFEQLADPTAYQNGQVIGTFARLSTVKAANALMWKLATINFNYIDLVHSGQRWLVVMPQVPVKSALSIAHEVASAGYHIQFQPGKKS